MFTTVSKINKILSLSDKFSVTSKISKIRSSALESNKFLPQLPNIPKIFFSDSEMTKISICFYNITSKIKKKLVGAFIHLELGKKYISALKISKLSKIRKSKYCFCIYYFKYCFQL